MAGPLLIKRHLPKFLQPAKQCLQNEENVLKLCSRRRNHNKPMRKACHPQSGCRKYFAKTSNAKRCKKQDQTVQSLTVIFPSKPYILDTALEQEPLHLQRKVNAISNAGNAQSETISLQPLNSARDMFRARKGFIYNAKWDNFFWDNHVIN